MKRNSILLCLLLAIAANTFTTAKAQVNTTDSLALVDLYNSTKGPHWSYHTNWLTTKPVSTWYGVTVIGDRVNDLNLQYNLLSGAIPASIGNLVKLDTLNLSQNAIKGQIPASIGNLTSLRYLNLEGGYAYEDISLTGSIPDNIGNLTNLTYLNISGNFKLGGTIPTSVGNLTNLTYLILASDGLSGDIPVEIGNLTNLINLDLANNYLTGAIHSNITKLVNLQYLELTFNKLRGTIPSNMGNLVNLTYLGLNNNNFSGSIPPTLGNLVNLHALYLHNNQLSGAIPATLGHLTSLTTLYLSHNQLSGAIPASLSKLKNVYLELSYNQLSQFGGVHSSLDTNYIRGDISLNRFTFDGLQVVAENYPNITYAPQETILPIHQNGNTLSVSAGGTLSKNTYRWFKAGDTGKTIIKQDSTFTPAQSGRYFVRVVNKIATSLTLYSDTVSYTMPVTQAESRVANVAAVKVANKQFSIYPNPASNVVHIQTNGTAIITLTNSAGKVLLSKNINNTGEINISAFANGTYYLQNKTIGEVQKVVVLH